MRLERVIQVRTQFEDLHAWFEAPEEVAFLRTLHRHLFGVLVTIEVRHQKRELEFFMVRRKIDAIIEESIRPLSGYEKSCERMAEIILEAVHLLYPRRSIRVMVSEDWENAAEVTYERPTKFLRKSDVSHLTPEEA